MISRYLASLSVKRVRGRRHGLRTPDLRTECLEISDSITELTNKVIFDEAE